jgi:hypothetical protein
LQGGLQTFVAGGSGAWQHERFSAAEQHAPGHQDDEFLLKKIGPSWKTEQAVDDDV